MGFFHLEDTVQCNTPVMSLDNNSASSGSDQDLYAIYKLIYRLI